MGKTTTRLSYPNEGDRDTFRSSLDQIPRFRVRLPLGTLHALPTNMNSSRAEFLRAHINRLARELDNESNPAKIRCIKQAIRAAEIELTEG